MKNRFESSVLCALEIEKHLKKNRNGRIIVLESTDSTNTYLKKLVYDNAATPHDCIIAKAQTGGRGRLGRSFSSAKDKGIYLSYLLPLENIPSDKFPQITAHAAVSVRNAILDICNVSTQIKWVNDLVYERKKLCGILTELAFSQTDPQKAYAVIGIGINVNHTVCDFPDELKNTATSLYAHIGNEINISKLCAALIEHLDKLCKDFSGNKEYYLSQYRENCAVLGKKVRIIKGDTERTGTAFGISENFGLVVDFEDGMCETITDGEVSVRGFYGYI